MKTFSKILKLILLIGFCSIQDTNLFAQTKIYVDSSAAPGGDGSSWAMALTSLADAISQANEVPAVDTIFIAKGTYYPQYVAPSSSATTDRDKTFFLSRDGLALIGGYPTGGGVRNWKNHPVILSGDLGTIGDSSDNAYHVILTVGGGSANPIDSTLAFDGITITGGNADVVSGITVIGATVNRIWGAGVYNENYSNPAFRNCTITGNRTLVKSGGVGYGGGMFNNNNSSPIIYNCVIIKNAGDYGGGFYNSHSSPSMVNCIIAGNHAQQFGGGIYNVFSSPSLVNCVISGNDAFFKAASGNPAGGNGGGILNTSSSNPRLINVTLSGNKSTIGGAVGNFFNSNPVISNSIIYGNSQGIEGDGTGTPVITYSLVQGYSSTAEGNIDGNTNPVFAAADSYTNAPATEGDYRLQSTSPDINKGNNDSIPATITVDLDGHSRINNGTVDLGAYEYGIICPGFHVIYVDSANHNPGDGSNWSNAINSLATAVKLAQECANIDTILIAKGTYYPEYKPPVDTAITNRDKSFYFFRDGLVLLGGYPNGGGVRNPKENPVILSGDLGAANDNSDNAYHVVLTVGGGSSNPIDSTLSFDGITITGGNADGLPFPSATAITLNGVSIPRVRGAGVHDNNYASPSFHNCNITGNCTSEVGAYSGYGGGMLNNNNSNPLLDNCMIVKNSALSGGGMYNLQYSSPSILNSIIAGNHAVLDGGGITNNFGSPSLINCVLSGNDAIIEAANGNLSTGTGGAMNNVGTSSPKLINVTISGNRAVTGGAIYYESDGNPVISNSIIYGNSSGIGNFGIGTLIITYSLVQGNTSTTNGNIDGNTNPLFAAGEAYMNAPTAEGDYRLRSGSPVINKGNNDSIPATITADPDEHPRISQGTVDMGAYEFVSGVLPLTLLSFDGEIGDNCKVSLTWHTANEENLASFILEQSTDAIHFKPIATQLSTNNGAGNWYHAHVLMDGPVDYYRLKMLDEDGDFTYSSVINASSKCVASDIQIYPNPARGTLFVRHSAQEMNYTLLDITGRALLKGKIENSVSAIPLSGLTPGTYLLRITTESGTTLQTVKFLKL